MLVGAPERDGGALVAVDGDEIHPVELVGIPIRFPTRLACFSG